jgi:hypothetical protein
VPYKDLVHTRDLVQEVVPLLTYFRDTRQPGETFGDFCARLGVEALRTWADAANDASAYIWTDVRADAQPGPPASPQRPRHNDTMKEAARANTTAAA